ncbi:MAG: DrmE family protein [Pseudomonadota bacterium]
MRDPVEFLKKTVDLTPYAFPPNAPKWLGALSCYLNKDLGILAILGPNGLNVSASAGVSRVSPDPLVLNLAALISFSREDKPGRNISLGLPPGARHIPLLFATTSVLADFLHKQTCLKGRPNKNLSGVLVVSKDLDIRSRYCDLKIKTEPLDHAYPGSRMRPNGEIVSLRPHANNLGGGVCFFSPGQNLPQTRLRPSLAILDFRYGILAKRVKEITLWVRSLHQASEILAIYTVGDRDTYDALQALRFENFPIDHEALSICTKTKFFRPSTQGEVDWNVMKEPKYLEREHQVILVEGGEVERSLIEVQQMLLSQRQQENKGLNRAFWIFATLIRLPVPPYWYEQSARDLGRFTLGRLIDQLAVRHDSGMGAALQALKMKFETILQNLQTSNPRAEKIKSVLPSLVEEGGEVLLLVRDKVSECALQNWLHGEVFPNASWLRKVKILACPNYSHAAQKSYPIVLANGAFPQRYRWAVGGALGDTVKFLAYSSEIETIANQLEDVYGEKFLQTRANERESFFSNQKFQVDKIFTVSKRWTPSLVFQKPQIASGKTEKHDTAFQATAKDFRDLPQILETVKTSEEHNAEIARLEEDGRRMLWEDSIDEESQDIESTELIGGSFHKDDVPCYRFEVQCKQGNRILWLAQDRPVECLKKKKNGEVEILALSPDTMDIGDTIVLVEENARGSLFDRVVQIAENQPELQYLAAYRRQWKEAIGVLDSKYRCFDLGYETLHENLRAQGSTISTSLSVRNWVRGYVIAPDDISSIIAVGRLAGFDSIEKDAQKFDKAFRAIRAIHQTLGRKLTRTIHKSSRYLTDEEDKNQTALWLPVEEILDTVDLAEIHGKAEAPRLYPPYMVGRLLTT